MAEFQKSRKLHGILFSRATLIVLSAFSAILIFGLFNIVPKAMSTSRNKDLIVGQLDSLKKQSDSLEGQIEKLKTNDGVEEKIREKFRVVKDGEGLVVIVDDQKPAEPEAPAKQGIFWSFLKDLFK